MVGDCALLIMSKRYLVSFLLLLCLFSRVVFAHPERITVVSEEWPPYNYTNEKGEFIGISTEIVKAVLTEAQLEYHIEVYPWNRAFNKARDNKNTLLYTIYRVGDRIDKFQWICPLVKNEGFAVYALAERRDIQLQQLSDAKKFRIGTLRSGGGYDVLKHAGFLEGKNMDIATDELANIRKLFKQRVDLIIQEVEPLKLRLKELELPQVAVKKVFSIVPDGGQAGCMAFSNDTPKAMVERVRAALKKVLAQRTLNKE